MTRSVTARIGAAVAGLVASAFIMSATAFASPGLVSTAALAEPVPMAANELDAVTGGLQRGPVRQWLRNISLSRVDQRNDARINQPTIVISNSIAIAISLSGPAVAQAFNLVSVAPTATIGQSNQNSGR